MVQVDPAEKTLFINIVDSKDNYKTIQDAVEETALEIKNPDIGAQIIPVIAEGFISKKKFKVTGVSYKSKLKFSIPLKVPELGTFFLLNKTDVFYSEINTNIQ